MSSTTLTLAQFKIDLAQLDEAIGTIQTQASLIGFAVSEITGTLQLVPNNWTTPAETPFSDLAQACSTRMTALNELLTEMVRRMRISYHNYLQAEQTNVSNLRS